MNAHHYDTGAHVALLLAHPEDYKRRCLSFFERCVHLHAARHSPVAHIPLQAARTVSDNRLGNILTFPATSNSVPTSNVDELVK